MKTIEVARQERLIKEAHKLLDRIESDLRHIFSSIKAKRSKKAA
jgi:hypothetical protein